MRGTAILGRLARPAMTLFFLSLAVFFVLQALPGGPFDVWARAGDAGASAADLQRIQALLGLNLPWPQRYLDWILRWLRGDWGISWSVSFGASVRDLVLSRLAASFWLAGAAFVLAASVSVVLGAWLALRPRGGEALLGLISAVHCIPTFFVGLLILTYFRGLTGLFPDQGLPGMDTSLGARLAFLVLPVLTLVLVKVNTWTRVFWTECERVLGQPFVVTAYSKGLSRGQVVRRHVLPNALGPFLSLLAVDLPALVSGALVVEVVFNYPGMGLLIYHAVRNGDWPVVQTTTLLAGIVVVAGNALADGLRSALDPRLRRQ